MDLFIEWWPVSAHEITGPDCGELQMLILTVRDERGRPRFICRATQLPLVFDMQPDIEVWGAAVNGRMECRQYSLGTNFEYYKDPVNRERKCDLVRDDMVYRCDERGKPLECLEYERTVVRSFPIKMPWDDQETDGVGASV